MTTNNLLTSLRVKQADFKEVLQHIDNMYVYTASAFTNGSQNNAENENQGSARVLFFAKLNNLSKEDTLELFAEHYASVLNTPEGTDHQNIRQFQLHGWEEVSFEKDVLTLK